MKKPRRTVEAFLASWRHLKRDEREFIRVQSAGVGVCSKISERNWLSSAGGIPPHPPSAPRLAYPTETEKVKAGTGAERTISSFLWRQILPSILFCHEDGKFTARLINKSTFSIEP
jgi:hypothetical protein